MGAPKTLPELTGRRFGRLIVLGLAASSRPHKRAWWVRCDCGTEPLAPPAGDLGGLAALQQIRGVDEADGEVGVARAGELEPPVAVVLDDGDLLPGSGDGEPLDLGTLWPPALERVVGEPERVVTELGGLRRLDTLQPVAERVHEPRRAGELHAALERAKPPFAELDGGAAPLLPGVLEGLVLPAGLAWGPLEVQGRGHAELAELLDQGEQVLDLRIGEEVRERIGEEVGGDEDAVCARALRIALRDADVRPWFVAD